MGARLSENRSTGEERRFPISMASARTDETRGPRPRQVGRHLLKQAAFRAEITTQKDATLPSAESSTLVESSSSAQQSAPQEPEWATTTDQCITSADTNRIAEGSTVQPTTSQDTNLAWASAAEDDENAAEDDLDTIDPVNVLDSYPNYNKRPAFIVIAKNSEVAVIDSFVEKAICKIKVRLTIEELYNANLHIRVAPMPVHDKTAACLEEPYPRFLDNVGPEI
jgi:hypothetical protein